MRLLNKRVRVLLLVYSPQVGVYNSPHLFHWSDAVLVDGSPDLEGWRSSMLAIQDALGEVDRCSSGPFDLCVLCVSLFVHTHTHARTHVCV